MNEKVPAKILTKHLADWDLGRTQLSVSALLVEAVCHGPCAFRYILAEYARLQGLSISQY